jgi:hypothetical protein
MGMGQDRKDELLTFNAQRPTSNVEWRSRLRTGLALLEVKRKKTTPIHPGEVLLEEFLQPMEISQYLLIRINERF